MAKKPTLRDIAKAAGVSVATVSYVLSNATNQKISHDVRIKVSAIAMDLGYVPNVKAKPIVKHRTNNLYILVPDEPSLTSSLFFWQADLIRKIRRSAAMKGYNCNELLIDKSAKNYDALKKIKCDGILIIDSNNDNIYEYTKKCYVPILFVDAILSDPIFCCVIPDYEAVIEKALMLTGLQDVFIILDKRNNGPLNSMLTKSFPYKNIFFNEPGADLPSFMKEHQGMNGIVIGEFLGLMVEKYHIDGTLVVITTSSICSFLKPETKQIVASLNQTAKRAVDTLLSIIDYSYDDYGKKMIISDDDERSF